MTIATGDPAKVIELRDDEDDIRLGDVAARGKETREWIEYPPGSAISVEVRAVKEDGGYSVYAAPLPGAISEGDSLAEAISNIREAIAGAVASYREHNDPIPWQDPPPFDETREKRLRVHVDVG